MRLAVVVHALAAWIIILGIVVHIYAAIWVRGTVRAMTRGTVSEAGPSTITAPDTARGLGNRFDLEFRINGLD